MDALADKCPPTLAAARAQRSRKRAQLPEHLRPAALAALEAEVKAAAVEAERAARADREAELARTGGGAARGFRGYYPPELTMVQTHTQGVFCFYPTLSTLTQRRVIPLPRAPLDWM